MGYSNGKIERRHCDFKLCLSSTYSIIYDGYILPEMSLEKVL